MAKQKVKYGVCHVCYIVDGIKEKKHLRYCPVCDAYICVECFGNLPKRALAAVKKPFLTKEQKNFLKNN
ncbi:MAG: hypothetical protein KatS3mg096_616 [Candidatus Parcubacteria bacterium]|nr:MAG: hypothetical protein KatS3mg096_616 [Candidatus Parcubacteria bacterium]